MTQVWEFARQLINLFGYKILHIIQYHVIVRLRQQELVLFGIEVLLVQIGSNEDLLLLLAAMQVNLMLEDRSQRLIRVTTLLDDVVGNNHVLSAIPTGVPGQCIVFPYLDAGTLRDHVHQDVILELVVHAHEVILAALHTNPTDLEAIGLDEDVHPVFLPPYFTNFHR